MAKTKKPETPEIAREEWDFSWVPERLVHDCWAYEYSREAMRDGKIMPKVVLDLLSDYLPSKKIPFENMPKVKKLVKKMGDGRKNESDLKDELATDLWRKGYDLGVSVGPVSGRENWLISIDWNLGVAALTKDFKELLKRQGKGGNMKPRLGGIIRQLTQRMAELKFLGALRIIDAGFTANAAIDMTQDIRGYALYEDDTRWMRNTKKARKLLSDWPSAFVGDIC